MVKFFFILSFCTLCTMKASGISVKSTHKITRGFHTTPNEHEKITFNPVVVPHNNFQLPTSTKRSEKELKESFSALEIRCKYYASLWKHLSERHQDPGVSPRAVQDVAYQLGFSNQ